MTKSEVQSIANSAIFVIGTAVVVTRLVSQKVAMRETNKRIKMMHKEQKAFDREFKRIMSDY